MPLRRLNCPSADRLEVGVRRDRPGADGKVVELRLEVSRLPVQRLHAGADHPDRLGALRGVVGDLLAPLGHATGALGDPVDGRGYLLGSSGRVAGSPRHLLDGLVDFLDGVAQPLEGLPGGGDGRGPGVDLLSGRRHLGQDPTDVLLGLLDGGRDLGRLLAGLLGQAFHLVRDDREPVPVDPRPGRLDVRVEGQDVRLFGDAVDEGGRVPDVRHPRIERLDELGEVPDARFDLLHRVGRRLRLFRSRRAHLRALGGPGCDVLGGRGDLLDGGGELGRLARGVLQVVGLGEDVVGVGPDVLREGQLFGLHAGRVLDDGGAERLDLVGERPDADDRRREVLGHSVEGRPDLVDGLDSGVRRGVGVELTLRDRPHRRRHVLGVHEELVGEGLCLLSGRLCLFARVLGLPERRLERRLHPVEGGPERPDLVRSLHVDLDVVVARFDRLGGLDEAAQFESDVPPDDDPHQPEVEHHHEEQADDGRERRAFGARCVCGQHASEEGRDCQRRHQCQAYPVRVLLPRASQHGVLHTGRPIEVSNTYPVNYSD